jgi:hypothetical protein
MDAQQGPQDSPGEVGHVVSPITEYRMLRVVELPSQSVEYLRNHVLGVDELLSQALADLLKKGRILKKGLLSHEDHGLLGSELPLDIVRCFVEILGDAIEGVLNPAQLLLYFVLFNVVAFVTSLQDISVNKRFAGR